MANVQISIRRENGTFISAEGVVDDLYIVDIATMLGAILFDSAAVSVVEPDTSE